jgi:bacterial/archaeal transporter family-2 protein
MLLAVSASISLVIQQALNANLRNALNSAAWSGFMSYLCMAIFALALRDPAPSAGVVARIPWWAWSGGLFGATFIALAMSWRIHAPFAIATRAPSTGT